MALVPEGEVLKLRADGGKVLTRSGWIRLDGSVVTGPPEDRTRALIARVAETTDGLPAWWSEPGVATLVHHPDGPARYLPVNRVSGSVPVDSSGDPPAIRIRGGLIDCPASGGKNTWIWPDTISLVEFLERRRAR